MVGEGQSMSGRNILLSTVVCIRDLSINVYVTMKKVLVLLSKQYNIETGTSGPLPLRVRGAVT